MRLKIRRILRYLSTNRWYVISCFFSFILVLYIITFVVNYVRYFYLQNEVESKESEISKLENKIDKLTSSNDYQKFEMVNYINKNKKGIIWNKTLGELINIYDKLRSISNAGENVSFDNFSVNRNNISLIGKVNNLKRIYSKGTNSTGGIIDNLNSLDFIEHIDIPSYTEEKDLYKFNLNAKIKLNEGNRK